MAKNSSNLSFFLCLISLLVLLGCSEAVPADVAVQAVVEPQPETDAVSSDVAPMAESIEPTLEPLPAVVVVSDSGGAVEAEAAAIEASDAETAVVEEQAQTVWTSDDIPAGSKFG